MVISSQNVNRQLRTWHESLMSCLFGGLKLILHRLAIMVFEPCFEQKQQPSNSGSLAVRAESSTSLNTYQVHQSLKLCQLLKTPNLSLFAALATSKMIGILGHANTHSGLITIFLYRPIRLQYSGPGVEQRSRFWLSELSLQISNTLEDDSNTNMPY